MSYPNKKKLVGLCSIASAWGPGGLETTGWWGGQVCRIRTEKRGGWTPSQMLRGVLGCIECLLTPRVAMAGAAEIGGKEGIQMLGLARNTLAWACSSPSPPASCLHLQI
eukprot:1149943-Pelagomonas_calceolata.AAC.2